jgi:multiple sugar transport system substrate-binding protein
MEEIGFSVYEHGAEPIAILRSLLAEFEARQHIRVHLSVLPFAGAWAKAVQMALYGDGPDVSAIGTSWVGDFVRMTALRPYSPQEIRLLGGADDFFAASWRSAILPDETSDTGPTLWAMPWLADTRISCYRRDLFERAGLDAGQVFQSTAQLEDALMRLRDSGVRMPLVLPTRRSRLALHTLASFIWGAGGDFLDERTGTLALDRPETLAGLRQYFRLGRYLTTDARDRDEAQSDALFRSGQAAITFSGHWLLQDQQIEPKLRAQFGVAPVIGVPFVGGYHLVIWQFSRKTAAALKLVEFLAGRHAPAALYPAFGLPARRTILQTSAVLQAPPFDGYAAMLNNGRSFPAGRMWGLIEKNLVDVIPLIWQEVLASDEAELDAILDRHIVPLANRLRLTLKA